jgi:hypothetical protein
VPIIEPPAPDPPLPAALPPVPEPPPLLESGEAQAATSAAAVASAQMTKLDDCLLKRCACAGDETRGARQIRAIVFSLASHGGGNATIEGYRVAMGSRQEEHSDGTRKTGAKLRH